MNKKVTTLLISAVSALSLNAQVVLSEDFNAPFTLNAATGWTVQNNSAPTNSVSWFQGNPNVFFAYNGNINDYYGVNFNSTTGGGTISNWLISPAVTIYNGAVFEFATRVPSQTAVRPDALQLRMSTVNTNVIPAGAGSVGTFTNLLLDINPGLTGNNTSAVNNGSVNGYPQSWTVFSVQVSGVTGTVTGRFAFRYSVSNAGSTGANSNYVGVDGVRYTLPCGASAQNYTICANQTTTILTTGGLPATTYSWNTGATTPSIVVSPATSTTYVVDIFNGATPCGVQSIANVVVTNSMSIDVSATSLSVCPGRTVTLTASGANTYSWNTGAQTQAITVTNTATTTYTVGGLTGLCPGFNTITIYTLPAPSLTVISSASISCPGSTLGLQATGGQVYTWVLGNNAISTDAITITTVVTSGLPNGGTFTVGLVGWGANGCSASGVLTRTVAPNPTITVVASPTNALCVNKTSTFTASGASTYTWSGAAASNAAVLTFSNGSSTGNKTFTIAGTSTAGCLGSTSITYTISACTGIENVSGNGLQAYVYPNPFSNGINLSGINGRVELYNALGQLILQTETNGNDTLNTTELPKGAYVLKAYINSDDVRTIKLLKN